MSLVTAFALTAGLVADAVHGDLAHGPAAAEFTTVSIDSRTLEPGALFVALRGERDGHTFVPDAISRGAAGVLVERASARALDPPAQVAVIGATDTLVALQTLGREVRRRAGSRVVAITGSAGKTTTKELTAALLSVRYRVFRNQGNFNNHIGLPLSLAALHSAPEIAVVELGMNHAGEIRQLVRLAEPDVRVWTNVGDAHLGHFESRDALARAKAEILEDARPADVAVLNADDVLVRAFEAGFAGRVLRFGTHDDAQVRAATIRDHGLDGATALVETPAGSIELVVRLPGRGHLLNTLAATAVAVHFGVPLSDIARVVAAQFPVARRGASAVNHRGVRVVDDSYNASPSAVQMMLQALAATAVGGRRIAMLGEMRELGDASGPLHTDCGRAAARARVDLLVAVGGADAEAIAAGARAAGMPPDAILIFPDSGTAADAAPELVRSGDTVLVKGSRGTRMDRVADRLLETP